MAGGYERHFTVEIGPYDEVPQPREETEKVCGHFQGSRIGFDAGCSDRKLAAVKDGEVFFADETVWHPILMEDPVYHFAGFMDSVKRAAEHLPRVYALGVSSAGT